ncbi:MAG TPA: ribonuclease E inhibitor RraB, partial [Pyrinomonadaceae bacterium]|nr:ribonuclease E inhibitor RraB [Pyrinomonadaceae bacterium]
ERSRRDSRQQRYVFRHRAHRGRKRINMEFKDTESQIEGIKKIFDDAKQEDNWNLGEEMLYSFYFVDEDVDKLEKLGLQLEVDGYDFIDIFELGDEETDESTGEYLLHIDKVEIHTPESLAQRNVEFAKLAEEYEIKTYDGWEFGEVGDYDDEDEETEESLSTDGHG